jgi:hypothetical protein
VIEIKSGHYVRDSYQLRDYACWEEESGYSFELWVEPGAELAPGLQQLGIAKREVSP